MDDVKINFPELPGMAVHRAKGSPRPEHFWASERKGKSFMFGSGPRSLFWPTRGAELDD